MSIDWQKFGELIRADREGRDMRQADYAVLLGLKESQQGTLSLMEKGKIKSPSYDMVQRLKAQLKLTTLPGEHYPVRKKPDLSARTEGQVAQEGLRPKRRRRRG